MLELNACRRISVQGVQFLDGAPWGLDAVDCREVNVNGCTFGGDLIRNRGEGAIRFDGKGEKNLISACQIDGAMKLDENAGVKVLNSIGDGVA